MNDREANFEKNLERLLQASCGPETRPASAARQELRRTLAAALRTWRPPTEFPAASLGVLTSLMWLCGASGAAVWSHQAGSPGSFSAMLLAVLVLVNLLGVPLAGLVVLLRRRCV